MKQSFFFSDIGQGACYLAIAASIIAVNRRELAACYNDLYNKWHNAHPKGKLWDDIRQTLNDTDKDI